MSFISKLVSIQAELNAPKNQRNTFGKYNYRSCEDILEAVKPLLAKHGLFLFIDDTIELIGDRYYVKATATITDGENHKSTNAYAREEQSKKGMDSSQLTGATSSYARKYALNGLLCIDDAKDADSNEQRNHTNNAPQYQQRQAPQQPAQQKPVDMAERLKSFTSAVSSAKTVQELDKFMQGANKLFKGPDLAKAQEVYQLKLNEIKG